MTDRSQESTGGRACVRRRQASPACKPVPDAADVPFAPPPPMELLVQKHGRRVQFCDSSMSESNSQRGPLPSPDFWATQLCVSADGSIVPLPRKLPSPPRISRRRIFRDTTTALDDSEVQRGNDGGQYYRTDCETVRIASHSILVHDEMLTTSTATAVADIMPIEDNNNDQGPKQTLAGNLEPPAPVVSTVPRTGRSGTRTIRTTPPSCNRPNSTTPCNGNGATANALGYHAASRNGHRSRSPLRTSPQQYAQGLRAALSNSPARSNSAARMCPVGEGCPRSHIAHPVKLAMPPPPVIPRSSRQPMQSRSIDPLPRRRSTSPLSTPLLQAAPPPSLSEAMSKFQQKVEALVLARERRQQLMPND